MRRADAEIEGGEVDPVHAGFRRADVARADDCNGFQYLPVTLVQAREDRRKSKWVQLRCLVDEGSNLSYVSQPAARRLGFEEAEARFGITLCTFGGNQQHGGGLPRVLKLKGLRDDEQYRAVVCELEGLQERLDGLSLQATRPYPHLRVARPHLPTEPGDVDLVIGYDLKALMIPREVYEGADGEPIAVATRVAWMILPPRPPEVGDKDITEAGRRRLEDRYSRQLRTKKALQARRVVAELTGEDWCMLEAVWRWCNGDPIPPAGAGERDHAAELEADFQQWCQADALGVAPTSRCVCTPKQIEEAEFITHVREHIVLVGQRVEVPLPWKPGYPQALRNNRAHAAALQRALMEKVDKSGLTHAYEEEMEVIVNQFSEPVPQGDRDQDQAWYLVHFPVQNRTKLRVVWNAARKTHGQALNDGLYKGPSLLNSLGTVLSGFRGKTIGVVGDIRKMYNQVQLTARDRDYHRFIWRGEDRRWTRLVFGDRPAPDIAIATLQFLAGLAQDEWPEAACILREAAYMDDIIFAVDTQAQAVAAQAGVEKILAKGSFVVKEWVTNSVGGGQDDQVAVLGVVWSRAGDRLGVRPPLGLPSPPLTKRKILAWIATLWDPLGIVAPGTVQAKVRMQAMWDCGLSWDEPLAEDDETGWRKALGRYAECAAATVPRFMGPVGEGATSLNVFCDAGRDAFGTAAWWATGDGRAFFVEAKTQVAPLKAQTVPRLELMALLLGARTAVRQAALVPRIPTSVVVWTDSKTARQWVAMASRRLKAFVAARVAEIHELRRERGFDVRRITTEENPADWLTKPIVRSLE